MGVIGSLPLARSTIRAALFCTICNLEISFSVMPKRRALQESILEEQMHESISLCSLC